MGGNRRDEEAHPDSPADGTPSAPGAKQETFAGREHRRLWWFARMDFGCSLRLFSIALVVWIDDAPNFFVQNTFFS